MTDVFMPANLFESNRAKIKVIGVGGGGGNAINHMVEAGLKDIDFIAVNTDAQDLRRNQEAQRVFPKGAPSRVRRGVRP